MNKFILSFLLYFIAKITSSSHRQTLYWMESVVYECRRCWCCCCDCFSFGSEQEMGRIVIKSLLKWIHLLFAGMSWFFFYPRAQSDLCFCTTNRNQAVDYSMDAMNESRTLLLWPLGFFHMMNLCCTIIDTWDKNKRKHVLTTAFVRNIVNYRRFT